MKRSIYSLSFIIFASVSMFAQNKALRGDEAINELKQTGQYDSLMQAVKAARKNNGRADEPTVEDAIGQSAKLLASDGATGDRFGISVAVSGDTAIVGAYNDDVGANADQGSAYVFVRSGAVWTQQAQLTAGGGVTGDQFGISVAISGDTAIVGADLDDVGANLDQGSAYVFVRSGGVWTQQGQLNGTGGAADDVFGYSVAISGDTIIVGAHRDDVGANANQGSAYVFVRSGVVWTQQAQINATDGAADDLFGVSVSIFGDTAIVGAYGDDVGANNNQGSAYVFVRSGAVWTQQAQLNGTGGAAFDQFGISVSISGDTAIVGVYGDDVGANLDQGSASVFVRSGTVWTQQAQLTAGGGAADDLFGYSVSISGDTAIVGAWRDDVGANADQGSASVFTRSGSVWTELPQLNPHDGAAGDFFGASVAISGNNMIVGAYNDDVGTNFDQGSAYVFRVLGSGWTQEAQKVASDGSANDYFGISVAVSGDTAIVGAWLDDVGANLEQGSAYVFVRSGTVWTQQAQLNAGGSAANDFFGFSVSISGDTAIVGAYVNDVGLNNNQGSAYVFVRSGAVWTQQAQLNATGGAANDQFGISVSISGDTIIVGAPFSDASVSVPVAPQALDQGAAFIFVNNLAPSAANVSVSGRVTTANGNGVRNAIVQLTGTGGVTRRAVTSSFGYYRFDDVMAGETYVMGVASKRHQFATRIVTVSDQLTDVDFVADAPIFLK